MGNHKAGSTELKVDLVAGFASFKFLPPPFSVGHNNLNPKLILKENGLEFRGAFFTNHKKYGDIEKVDCSVSSIGLFGKNMIRLSFTDTIFTFSGNIRTLEGLKEVLAFLDGKGCLLSEKAKNLLEN